jgi:hypothetical protein
VFSGQGGQHYLGSFPILGAHAVELLTGFGDQSPEVLEMLDFPIRMIFCFGVHISIFLS